jgi:hypothetical protein
MGRKPSYSRLFPTLLLTSPKPNTLRRLSSVDSTHGGPDHNPHHEEEEERCPKRRAWSPFRRSCSSEDMLLAARDGTEDKRSLSSPPFVHESSHHQEACPAEASSSPVVQVAAAVAVAVPTSAGAPAGVSVPLISSQPLKKNVQHRRRQSEPPLSSATFSQHQTERKSVRFGKCLVRSYSQVLGDHPCCATGCPLTLGWDYQEESVTAVVADGYNDSDASETGSSSSSVGGGGFSSSKKPRSSQELRLTYDERRAILSNVSDANIRRHCRQWQREQQQQGGGCSSRSMKRLQQRVERDFFRQVQDGEEEDYGHHLHLEDGTSSDDATPLAAEEAANTEEPLTDE